MEEKSCVNVNYYYYCVSTAIIAITISAMITIIIIRMIIIVDLVDCGDIFRPLGATVGRSCNSRREMKSSLGRSYEFEAFHDFGDVVIECDYIQPRTRLDSQNLAQPASQRCLYIHI